MDLGFSYVIRLWHWHAKTPTLDDDANSNRLVSANRVSSVQFRLRFCKVMLSLSLSQPQPTRQLIDTLRAKLFGECSYLPSGQPVPQHLQDEFLLKVVELVESLLCEDSGCIIDADSFVIAVMFGTVKWGSSDDQTAKIVRDLMEADKFMGSCQSS